MTTLPEIAIQICTYDRYSELCDTIKALQELVDYPQSKVKLYISDDSSPDEYFNRLKRLKIFKFWETFFISTAENSGWGANVNNGLSQITQPYIFFIEDDYILKKPLDLRVGVALLEKKPNIGMVRYRGSAGSNLVYHQMEVDLSDYQADSAFDGMPWSQSIEGLPWKLTYLQIGGGSPDLYLYSHGAHLKRRSFHEFYGMYPEGMKLGHTEEAFAHTVKDRMRADPDRAPGIAILPEWIPMWFDHIGVSYQLTEKDK